MQHNSTELKSYAGTILINIQYMYMKYLNIRHTGIVILERYCL